MKSHFEVFQPATIAQAIALKQRHGKTARFWAGGTDMTLLWQRSLIDLDQSIDITGVGGLDRIKVGKQAIEIGALVTLAQLERAAERHGLLKTLSDVTKLMCTPQTRTLATVGGNICNASPAADLSPVFVALDASAVLTGTGGDRSLKIVDFFTGPKRTAIKASEMLTGIKIPLPSGTTAASYRRVARTVVDIALVNASSSVTVNAKGAITRVLIGLGAVGPVILRAPEAEKQLLGKSINELPRRLLEEAGAQAAAVVQPISDVRASADYRRHMTKILVRRTLDDCIAELGGQTV